MVQVLVSYTDRALNTTPALLQALQQASDALVHLLDLAKLDDMDKDTLLEFINKHPILQTISNPEESELSDLRAQIKATLNIPTPKV
jgi:hypothetical protein